MIGMVILATIALSSSADQHTAYDQFQREFSVGADCPRLFRLRNQAKVSATASQAQEMNDKLRSVRCFSATSKRAPTTTGDGDFTVKDYRLYRAVIDAPLSVPEARAIGNAAKKYGVTDVTAKRTVEKVTGSLAEHAWFATLETEIRHASDWKGQQQ